MHVDYKAIVESYRKQGYDGEEALKKLLWLVQEFDLNVDEAFPSHRCYWDSEGNLRLAPEGEVAPIFGGRESLEHPIMIESRNHALNRFKQRFDSDPVFHASVMEKLAPKIVENWDKHVKHEEWANKSFEEWFTEQMSNRKRVIRLS